MRVLRRVLPGQRMIPLDGRDHAIFAMLFNAIVAKLSLVRIIATKRVAAGVRWRPHHLFKNTTRNLVHGPVALQFEPCDLRMWRSTGTFILCGVAEIGRKLVIGDWLFCPSKYQRLVPQIARCHCDVRCDSNRTRPNR